MLSDDYPILRQSDCLHRRSSLSGSGGRRRDGNLRSVFVTRPGANLHLSFTPLNNGSVPTAYDQSRGGIARSGTISLANNDKLSAPGLGEMEIIADTGTSFLAFGYWNAGGDDVPRLTISDANGNFIESAVSSPDDPAFIGIIGSVAATRAVIEAVEDNTWFTIDDLQIDAASVPVQISEPAGFTVLLLAALFLRHRSRTGRDLSDD